MLAVLLSGIGSGMDHPENSAFVRLGLGWEPFGYLALTKRRG
jgi:hypothetical protein